MGYYTRVTGEIRIEPPIPYAEFKGTDWVNLVNRYHYDVRLLVEESEVDTAEGPAILSRAVAIVPSMDDEYKAYDIEAHVQSIVDQFGATREFTGYLYGEGEEATDMWRLYVRGGEAMKIRPEVVWPND